MKKGKTMIYLPLKYPCLPWPVLTNVYLLAKLFVELDGAPQNRPNNLDPKKIYLKSLVTRSRDVRALLGFSLLF